MNEDVVCITLKPDTRIVLLHPSIADFETSTGIEFAKKFMPDTLAKEIEKKKRNRTK